MITIHKAKGKEFDRSSSVIYEGTFSGRIVTPNAYAGRVAQSRLALGFPATRVIRSTTILTHEIDGCQFL